MYSLKIRLNNFNTRIEKMVWVFGILEKVLTYIILGIIFNKVTQLGNYIGYFVLGELFFHACYKKKNIN